MLLLAALVVSEVFTDSVYAMQWLWFVPRVALGLAALAVALAALLAARTLRASPRDLRVLAVLAALSVAACGYGVLQMWGLPARRPAHALRVVHLNACYPLKEDLGEWTTPAILAVDADVIVLTDPGAMAVGERAERLAAAGYKLLRPGRFAVLSRLPVREAVPIVDAEKACAARIVIETPSGPLSIRAVDLPSSPRLSRVENARALVESIAKVDQSEPDLVIGDFNIPGGSRSLEAFGRGYREAFATAGTGWGGTYPRDFPLWRIDLALVRRPWKPVRAEIIDLYGKRHLAQAIDLVREK